MMTTHAFLNYEPFLSLENKKKAGGAAELKNNQESYSGEENTSTSHPIHTTTTPLPTSPSLHQAFNFDDNQHKTIQMHNMKESPLIEFILRKDPRENSVQRLHKECLKVSKEISIHHLKKFLSKKLGHESWEDFQLTANIGGRQVVLEDSIQLKEVRDEICDFHDDMMIVLQYFVQPFSLPPKELHEDNEGETNIIDTSRAENNLSNGGSSAFQVNGTASNVILKTYTQPHVTNDLAWQNGSCI